jgi:hypothetical protein
MKGLKEKIKESRLGPFARLIYQKIKNDKYDKYSSHSGSTKILLACFPKSGSTFTSNVIAQKDGFRKVDLVPAYGNREQELDIRYLYKHRNINFVAQHHIKNSMHLEELLQQYNVKPIILVRNIYDCIVSNADHFRNEGITWFGVINEEHLKLADEQLYSIIADLLAPWYISFYVSWKMSSIEPLIIKYEDMINDPENYFKKIFDAVDINITSKDTTELIGKAQGKYNRFNKGIKGRGDSVPPEVKKHIERLASHYPTVDFSDIGIS